MTPLHMKQTELLYRESGILMDRAYYSTCKAMGKRTKVGAAIMAGGSIFHGTNVTPCGEPLETYGEASYKDVLQHAEREAIRHAGAYVAWRCVQGLGDTSARLAVNEVPCPSCAREIIAAGIKEVYICAFWQAHASHLGPDPRSAILRLSGMLRPNGIQLFLDPTGWDGPARRDDHDFVPNRKWFKEFGYDIGF